MFTAIRSPLLSCCHSRAWMAAVLGKLRTPAQAKKIKPGKGFVARLRPYQIDGLNWLAGDGNIGTDPLFVDPANGDYHLYGWSSCIDAATASGHAEDPTTRRVAAPRVVPAARRWRPWTR